MKCIWHLCSKEAIFRGKFCGEKCANKYYVQRRRRNLKIKAIEYKGDCCSICGYDKCSAALDFHHSNPDDKELSISKQGHTISWKRMKQELDKCVLVCSNCHREIHADEYNKKVNGGSGET